MPVLIPAILAGGLAAWGAAAGAGFAAFYIAFAQTLVLTVAAQALQKKPEAADPNSATRTQTLRTPMGARQFIYGRVRVGGQLTFGSIVLHDFGSRLIDGLPLVLDGRNVNRTMNLVVTLAGHEVESIDEVWFNDDVLTLGEIPGNAPAASGKYLNAAAIVKYLGTADDNMAEFQSWANVPVTFNQRGCAKLRVLLAKNAEVYTTGVPNISAVVKGKNDVYDPRTGLTGWSDSPPLCIVNYLCTPKIDGGFGANYATDIDEAALIAAANICDELIIRKIGSGAIEEFGNTEKRYTLNGAFLTSTVPQDNIKGMLSSMSGTLVFTGGKWIIRAGAWVAPEITLDDGDARGPIQVQARMSRAEIFNAVKGTFTNPDKNWQPDDLPPVTNALYLAEDGGEQLYGDIQLPFTISPSMGQRLEKIQLERARQQITETFPGKISCLRLRAGDTVLRTSADMGWTDKPFEVTNLKLVIYNDDGGAPALGVDLVLRETAASVWDWNAGEETTVDPAPDTGLPNPFTPLAPGIASIVESLYETTGSAGVKARVTVTLGTVDEGDHPDYGVEYQLVSEGIWHDALTKNSYINFDDLAPGIYDFRARTFNALNVASVYSDTTRKEIFGLTAPPSDITNFSVRAIAGVAWAMLDKVPDLDVIQGGRIVVRWSPNTSASWNEGSLLNPEGFPGDSTLILLPLYTGTYMAKAQDSTGHLSDTEATFHVVDSNIVDYSAIATVTEDPTFPGTKVRLAVVGGGLQLSGASAVDDIVMVDSVVDWDAEGGTATDGVYTFNGAMNLGSSQTARLFPSQRGINTDTGDKIDDRAAPIDTWTDIDGAVVDDVESTLYVRVTTDNPAGTPTWGPWHPLPGPADYTFWGAQFKLVFVSADQTHNRNVDKLSVVAKQPA